MQILTSFKVNWKTDEYNKFLELYPDTVIKPCFHGTGSIAASMILRFGFIVKSESKTNSSGVSTAGRMLGDGIYFATNIDKVMAYASDGAWTHRLNEEGYIFEMSAILGKEGVNYKASGIESDSIIRSPEYCIFEPEKQLNLYRVHKIKQVSIDYIKELETKY